MRAAFLGCRLRLGRGVLFLRGAAKNPLADGEEDAAGNADGTQQQAQLGACAFAEGEGEEGEGHAEHLEGPEGAPCDALPGECAEGEVANIAVHDIALAGGWQGVILCFRHVRHVLVQADEVAVEAVLNDPVRHGLTAARGVHDGVVIAAGGSVLGQVTGKGVHVIGVVLQKQRAVAVVHLQRCAIGTGDGDGGDLDLDFLFCAHASGIAAFHHATAAGFASVGHLHNLCAVDERSGTVPSGADEAELVGEVDGADGEGDEREATENREAFAGGLFGLICGFFRVIEVIVGHECPPLGSVKKEKTCHMAQQKTYTRCCMGLCIGGVSLFVKDWIQFWVAFLKEGEPVERAL